MTLLDEILYVKHICRLTRSTTAEREMAVALLTPREYSHLSSQNSGLLTAEAEIQAKLKQS